MEDFIREIDALMVEGFSFDEIEEHIEKQPLDDESKSVLWLWAWVESDRESRRRVVREMVEKQVPLLH